MARVLGIRYWQNFAITCKPSSGIELCIAKRHKLAEITHVCVPPKPYNTNEVVRLELFTNSDTAVEWPLWYLAQPHPPLATSFVVQRGTGLRIWTPVYNPNLEVLLIGRFMCEEGRPDASAKDQE